MKMNRYTLQALLRRWLVTLLLVAPLVFSLVDAQAGTGSNWRVDRGNIDEILLLVPDNMSASDPKVTIWVDAAREEGLHVRPLSDSGFINLGADAARYKGVIMPDQIHIIASDALVMALRSYVSVGGKLMLVYDAGVLNSGGFYPSPHSRFSDMVGVSYALYESLRDYTIGFGHVTGMRSALRTLGVPPGKSMLYPAATTGTSEPLTAQYVPFTITEPSGLVPVQKEPRRVGKHRGDSQAGDDSNLALRRTHGPKMWKSKFPPVVTPDVLHGISGYYYGFLGYPSYVTQGTYAGTALLTSPDHGLVAGTSNFGAGQVLFVNTPLGYLKGYGTDGLLLHGFLRHFAQALLQQPILVAVPEGKGGLVLNVHTDYLGAIPATAMLNDLGIWDSGPFSIHYTAGPDNITFGDGQGLDVEGNATTQSWIRFLRDKGHETGSHGGWIHDWFAEYLTESNKDVMTPYLVWNKNALESVTGRPVIEYSAPGGNMPKWVVDWCEQQGMLGYYFVGNTGLSPTRSYREGVLQNKSIWSFPITPYGKAATFEEFADLGVSTEEATAWFSELTDFAIDRRTARLIYFHPPGAQDYNAPVVDLMRRTKWYDKKGKFGWYTMAGLSNFLSARDLVSWQVAKLSDGRIGIEASHPTDLKQQTWVLPKSAYGRPSVIAVNGEAVSDCSRCDVLDIANDPKAHAWVVSVRALPTPVRSLQFAMPPATMP